MHVYGSFKRRFPIHVHFPPLGREHPKLNVGKGTFETLAPHGHPILVNNI